MGPLRENVAADFPLQSVHLLAERRSGTTADKEVNVNNRREKLILISVNNKSAVFIYAKGLSQSTDTTFPPTHIATNRTQLCVKHELHRREIMKKKSCRLLSGWNIWVEPFHTITHCCTFRDTLLTMSLN